MPLAIPPPPELDAILRFTRFDGLRVLEIGTGDGRLAFPFAQYATQWIATDIDADELQLAAKTLKHAGFSQVHLTLAHARQLAFQTGYFDVVFFAWSLCCIDNADKTAALNEAQRVLKSNGLLLDVHATDEAPHLQVWWAEYGADLNDETPTNLAVVHRQPIGFIKTTASAQAHFTSATDALAELLDTNSGLHLNGTHTFDYTYSFDTLDELSEYLEGDTDETGEAAELTDALLERALLALQNAKTKPKLMLLQKTLVTAVEVIGK